MLRDSLSILIVDDTKFSCKFIHNALKKEGYVSINVVNNAAEALRHLIEHPVDVLLADWLMPEMDALELAKKIRQLDQKQHRYTGIVSLTAEEDIASVCTALEQGIDDYIVKPPNQLELASRIYAAGRVANLQNKLLQSSQTLQSLHEQECTIDKITGLGRLEESQRRLDALLKQTLSRNGETCTAILKITDIKKISEQYDERVYEQLISSVAQRILKQLRPIDLVGHINKDEFLIAIYSNSTDNTRYSNFKQILHDLNQLFFKTDVGYLNIHCAMAMAVTKNGESHISVKELMSNLHKKLQKSIAVGYDDVAG